MRKLNYFDWNPRGTLNWLHRCNLRASELVTVNGATYRYNVEREGREHTLTPVDLSQLDVHAKFGRPS